MADDLAALIKSVNALRMETNTALGELTPRNARRVYDRLRPEREATNRLVSMTDERLVRVMALVRKQMDHSRCEPDHHLAGAAAWTDGGMGSRAGRANPPPVRSAGRAWYSPSPVAAVFGGGGDALRRPWARLWPASGS